MQHRVAAEFERLVGITLKTAPYTGRSAFSYMLTSLYDFFSCEANGRSFLLMCLKEKSEYSPGRIAKHMAQAQNISGLPAVFAADTMVPYKRRRFLEKHIPFIIPGKQAYIPSMVLPRSAKSQPARRKSRPPASAAVLFRTFREPAKR